MDFATRLAHIRSTFEALPDCEEKRNMVWRAYLFAALSTRTTLERHEKAYTTLIKALPSPLQVGILDTPAIGAVLASEGVNYPYQKAKNLVAAASFLNKNLINWSADDKTLRNWFAQALPGVGMAKASFMLMLLGRTGVMCVDTHMAQLLKRNFKKLGSNKYYEATERKFSRAYPGEPGITQWRLWSERLSLDENQIHIPYFESQSKGISSLMPN
jgi:endonuclease III